jgi:predicted MPP superfamily phosphohydrolase
MPEVRIARIVAQVNALHGDAVVITGDFHASKFWNPPMRLEEALRPLTGLRAPLGVWNVPGNHDDPYWTRLVMGRFGLNLLASASVDLGPVQLVGVDDMILGFDPVAGLHRAAASANPTKPVIALAHEPDFFRVLPGNVSLLLAGHTHGGQIRVFGLPRLFPYYESHRRGWFGNARGQQMIVSSGLGTTFVPIRIGVPPEIVVIELVPGPADVQPPGRNSGTER